ncbi:MAG: hypothetical protein ACREMG_07150 [Gemmatimonadales bacterium]
MMEVLHEPVSAELQEALSLAHDAARRRARQLRWMGKELDAGPPCWPWVMEELIRVVQTIPVEQLWNTILYIESLGLYDDLERERSTEAN